MCSGCKLGKLQIASFYGFTGELFDDDFGLLYLRARYYSPYLNHFLTRDPFPGYDNLPQSQNDYNYVNNNPINAVDPSGMCAEVGDDSCWSVWEKIVRLCPECAQLERPALDGDGYRLLHEENVHYLRRMYERVLGGWRPLLATDRSEALQFEATRYGVPVEIVAGVLEAEIELDTDWLDRGSNWISRFAPWLMPTFLRDPGVGIGNVHISAARDAARHFEEHYPYCPELRLDISSDVSNSSIVWRETNDQYTIRLMAADIRQLADYRFGSNGNPSTISHADLSTWMLEDAIAMWHGYRYGVRDITPGGRGFVVSTFQDRTIPLETLVSSVVQGPGAEESTRGAIPIFVKYLGWRTIR